MELDKMDYRKKRQIMIMLLYKLDLLNETPQDLDSESLPDNDLQKELIDLVDDVYKKLFEIDYVIEQNLVNWKINRLNYVDRAIIRYATYEMMFTDTPVEIIINEALEITKEMSDSGDQKQKAFNNKVLDNIKKSI